MQVDFLPGGVMEKPGHQDSIPLALERIGQADLTVAANFWLPARHILFAANRLWRKPGQLVEANGEQFALQPMFCVQDSFGAELAPSLPSERIEKVFHMGSRPEVLPHSAFFDADGQATGLDSFLRERGVRKILLTGLPDEAAVLHTLKDAELLGYQAGNHGDF